MGLEQKIYDLALFYTDGLTDGDKNYFNRLFDVPVSKLNVSQKRKIWNAWNNATTRFLLKMNIDLKAREFLRSMSGKGFIFKKQRKILWGIIHHAYENNKNPQFDEWFIRHQITKSESKKKTT